MPSHGFGGEGGEHKLMRVPSNRSELYAGPDAEWPERDPDRNNEIMGVPRTIARYEGKEKDYAFDWPSGGCTEYVPSPQLPVSTERSLTIAPLA